MSEDKKRNSDKTGLKDFVNGKKQKISDGLKTNLEKAKRMFGKENLKKTFGKENLRQLPSKLWKSYKAWLYKAPEPKHKKVSYGVKRSTALWIFGIFTVVFVFYYMGLYDVSFIRRPEAWRDNGKIVYSALTGKAFSSVADSGTGTEGDNGYKAPGTVSSVDLSHTVKKNKKKTKINYDTVFKTDNELAADGYYLTSSDYSEDTCEVGLMSFAYKLPARFSYSQMTLPSWEVTSYDDGRMSTAKEIEKDVTRPAIYLYMGYIIYDDSGKNLYLADSRGNIIMNYDRSYIPAFARDTSGRPLFYRTTTFYAEAANVIEKDKAHGETVTNSTTVTLQKKVYYAVSAGGYFTEVDYIEERDGRGLNFDFNADYGVADTGIKRVGIMTPTVTTHPDGTVDLINKMRWNYYLDYAEDIPDFETFITEKNEYNLLPLEDRLKSILDKTTPKDKLDIEAVLPYTHAYNYSEGYATVEITDTSLEEILYNTKELRVIDTYGGITFNSRKKYYNTSIKDYSSDRYLLPLTRGEESIGSLYFDKGLMRIRKLSFDQYQLDEFKDLRINSDKDVLIYPGGSEFPIPDGYNLKAYSDGILLLEKDGLYGYMDTSGKWIADPTYKEAGAFHGGVGVLKYGDGLVGAVNTNGDPVLPFKFSYISNRSEGILAAYSETDGWQVYGIFTK